MRLTRTLLIAAGITALLGMMPASAAISSPVAAMTVAAPPVVQAPKPSEPEPANDIVADVRLAEAVLRDLQADYRHLDGVTVSVGTTPNGEEAVAYYTEGRIVISRTHTVGIDKILAHEVWHIIDWRTNGRLDWHENLPPVDASDYRRT